MMQWGSEHAKGPINIPLVSGDLIYDYCYTEHIALREIPTNTLGHDISIKTQYSNSENNNKKPLQ